MEPRTLDTESLLPLFAIAVQHSTCLLYDKAYGPHVFFVSSLGLEGCLSLTMSAPTGRTQIFGGRLAVGINCIA